MLAHFVAGSFRIWTRGSSTGKPIMPTKTLTDAFVRGLKATHGEVIDLKSGVSVRADKEGRITFSFRYRNGAARRRIAIGRYPEVALVDARAEVARIRERVRTGADPQGERVTARAVAAGRPTFNELADIYIERYAKRQKASWRHDQQLLSAHARPTFGKRDASSITRQEIARRLFEVADTAPVSANRLRSVLLKMFSWANDNALLDNNPGLGVKKPHRESRGKIRVLSDAELRVLWRAFDTATRVRPEIISSLRTLLLLGQRPGEVVGTAVDELHDLDKPAAALWSVPAHRMKGRRAHLVPLPKLACGIIRAEIARRPGREFVFGSKYAARAHVSRTALSHALISIIINIDDGGDDAKAVASLKADRPTPHDLRRTTATTMSKIGIPREDRLAVLAHTTDDVHGKHYDMYDRLREKRIALEAWERHIRKVIAGKSSDDGADIVPLRSRSR
jgi:integrase